MQIERAHVGNSPSKFARASLLSRIPDMGKPPFKASEGGRLTCLMSWEDFTFGEFSFVNEMGVLFLIEVRLEAFPNGLPMSAESEFLQY